MIVYVETNFLLEVVFDQEESTDARFLIEQAVARRCELRIPNFCIAESVIAFEGRRANRDRLRRELQSVTVQITRSSQHADLTPKSFDLRAGLIRANESQSSELRATLRAALACARFLQPSEPAIDRAEALAEKFKLSFQDSIVLAVILHDAAVEAATGRKIYVSRDRRGFDKDLVRSQLKGVDCTYSGSFKVAADIVRSDPKP
jgi:predicted nucleic acid-binding protein